MSLAELLNQKAELERQIAAAQSETRAKAISDVRALMAEHGLTAADLISSPVRRHPRAVKASKPVAAKYKDDHGNSWSGRGLKPKWLTAELAAGKTIDQFVV
jgi:DNA-binding protein H-NS